MRGVGAAVPETLGELMHCVYESLALCYREAVEGLSQLAGHEYASHQHRRRRLPGRPLEPPHPPKYAAFPCTPVPWKAPRSATWPCRCSPTGVFPHLKAVRAAIAESFDVQKVEP